jgi:hypothetical protein
MYMVGPPTMQNTVSNLIDKIIVQIIELYYGGISLLSCIQINLKLTWCKINIVVQLMTWV